MDTSPHAPGSESFGLEELVGLLRRRIWLLLGITLFVGLLVLGVSLLLPAQYESSAELVYRPENLDLGILDARRADTADHSIAGDAWAIETRTVAEEVAAVVGGTPDELLDQVETSPDENLGIITVQATAEDPEQAALIANTFARQFIALREEDALAEIRRTREVVQTRLDALTAEQRQSAVGEALQQRYDELLILESLPLSDYEVLQEAVAQPDPVAPHPWRNAIFAAVVALMLAVGGVIAVHYFRPRLTTEEDVEAETGFSVLGTVPALGKWDSAGRTDGAVGFREGNEEILEAFRVLRSGLQIRGLGDKFRVMAVTSAFPEEGKTTTAINLAFSLAMSGERVLLIDADLRKPKINEYLDLPNDRGLTTVLTGEEEWGDAMQPVDVPEYLSRRVAEQWQPNPGEVFRHNLACLTSGPPTGSPAELLSGMGMRELLNEASLVAPYVIVDTAPLLMVGDALNLLGYVDSVLLATRANRLSPKDAAGLRRVISGTQARVLGAVVTGGSLRGREHHSYYYYYAGQSGEGSES